MPPLAQHPAAIADAERRVDRWIAARPGEERVVLVRYRTMLVNSELAQTRIAELLLRIAELETCLKGRITDGGL
jgi:hypothetical protein